jgi:transcription elongation factor S-II
MNSTRSIVLNKFKNIENLPLNTCKNIEISIYNSVIKDAEHKNIEKDWDNYLFKHLYTTRALEIFYYLNSQPLYCKEIVENKLSKTIGNLNILTKEHKHVLKKQEKEQTPLEDGFFQCKRCKSYKTSYYSLQTRSSDEPMTNFITCHNCNNRWKFC